MADEKERKFKLNDRLRYANGQTVQIVKVDRHDDILPYYARYYDPNKDDLMDVAGWLNAAGASPRWGIGEPQSCNGKKL